MALRWIVTAQLLGDNGGGVEVMWGYNREQVIPNLEDVQEAILTAGQDILDSIDEAKASIGAQIAADAKASGRGDG